MDDKKIAENKLQHIASAKDLSNAIKKLEREKEKMENDLKNEIHDNLNNLKPVNLLNQTLEGIKNRDQTQYPLLKKAFEVGAGYFSKRKLIRKFKNVLMNTFRMHTTRSIPNPGAVILKQYEVKQIEYKEEKTNFKEMDNQDQIEKVKAKPENLPDPTYWPFFLALGLVFLGWGLLTIWLISLAGLIITIVSLIGWINILRHE